MAFPLPVARLRWLLLALVALTGACLLAAPAAAPAAKKKKAKPAFPTISKVSPARARVGETLTIRGRNFLVGKNRTMVVFKRDGKKAVFVKAQLSTKRMLRVTVPTTLEGQLGTKDGVPLFTKFRLRIGAKRFAPRYTSNRLSVGPEVKPTVDIAECEKVLAGADPTGDLDNDLLTNAEERALTGMSPCSNDTDGDGAGDGWEYFSAKDINQRAVPYPAKRPWPNPLQPDATSDYDGDGLTAQQEHDLWLRYGRPYQAMENRADLLYSDGTKTSSGPGPSQPADLATLQANAGACGDTIVPPNLAHMGRGYVDATVAIEDDEKDADQDGLNNWSEFNGWMQQSWWRGVYPGEKPYPLRGFQDLDPFEPDVDGDGCLDGLDDQDADDWANWTEHGQHATTWFDGATQRKQFASIGDFPSWNGWANDALTGPLPFAAHPFNPCLPETTSRTCSKYVTPTYPPFSPDYQDACTTTSTYRARTITVWLWNPAKNELWNGDCPPTP
jgi:hypothetical protein